MSLPVSDFDNPHLKHKKKYTTRIKYGVYILTLGLVVFLLFKLIPTDSSAVSNYSGHNDVSPSVTECKVAFDKSKPVNQYVVMIDAGSSGSRVHVYKFNNCHRMPRLEHEEFKMIEPGLSSYKSDPQEAAKSLDSLLQVAMDYVPEHERSCTPIAVKATAGLRKVGEEGAKVILDAVRDHLEKNYPFPIIDNGVEIMSGEMEGVYAWVTANFLLGKIGTNDKIPTVAVFDLGGGSTQLVFEPTFTDPNRKMIDGDHKYSMDFGGRHFDLYQHSYLGYGLNEARERMNSEIVKSQKGIKQWYRNPCLPPQSSVVDKAAVPDGTTSKEDGEGTVIQDVTFKGPDVFSPFQCRAFAEKILDKEAQCAIPPCAFAGIHQPNFYDAFPVDSDLYVFSFFYDRTAPLGMPNSFTLDELRDLTNLVCQGEDAYSAFESVDGAVEALQSHPQWCADLSYIEALLHTGYEIKGHREVKIAKKINGNELGWCLGASLPLLDKTNWKCK